MKRKLVSAILCGAMVLAMMTGCGSSGDAKGDKITINLYQNKSEMADQLQAAAEKYSEENPETVTSIGKDGNAKNKYTITKGLPTVPTTEAPANSIVFNIVNTTENSAQSLKAYSETNGLDYETLTFKCIVKQAPDTKNDKILTNVAWIADAKDSNGNSVIDRDSSPTSSPNVNRDNMENYTGNSSNKNDLDDDNYFYKGEQDDTCH